ncbi:MAG: hypothetical protein Rubg2KO_29580 [Rubricoccaceae bacterium]
MPLRAGDPTGRPPPRANALLNAIGWFIPDRERNRVSLLRAQLYVVFSILLTANTGLFAILHRVHHVPGSSETVIGMLDAMCVASLILPFLLKLGLPMTTLSRVYVVVLQVGVISIACVDGGFRSGAMFWLVVAPLAGAFLGGARLGWMVSSVSIAASVTMLAAMAGGYTFSSSLSANDAALHYAINFVCCAAFVAGISALYEGPMVRHFKDLSGRLQTINQDLRYELTERQRAQAQAEAASRAKDVLLANMSHEFRTPLTAILGFTEILTDEAAPDHKPLLESIDRGGRRLLNTLNGVLDLAWIEGSETDIDLKSVDAQAIVGDIASRFVPVAVERGLTFEVSGTDVLVHADPEALRRVIAALIDNAVRFTEHGSVSVSVLSDGDHALVRVSDTGIGMVPDFVSEAVQPFRQASEGDARTHEGVGVGLTVAERLLDMMGGELFIESAPGDGTTVTLRLPVYAPEKAVETEVGALAA